MERDPEAKANGIAYTYLQTPEEIHRLRILSVMSNICHSTRLETLHQSSLLH